MVDLRYAIITPAHNEAAFLPRVIASIAAQTVPPSRWVIVDDRSTDDTLAAIERAAAEYPMIQPLRLTGDRERRLGPNVVHVFDQGLAALEERPEFLVKMDADVLLPPNYFETLLNRFAADPRLGMASGKTYVEMDGKWILERCPDFHVVGPCKMYRTACFEAIGGIQPYLGWDILDGTKARQLGWATRSYRELPVYHLRLMGQAMGMFKTHLSYGRATYIIRSHPLFVLGRAVYRALERPYLSGLWIAAGWVLAAIKRVPRMNDLELARFLRREQLNRLLGRTLGQEEFLPQTLELPADVAPPPDPRE